MRFIWLFNIMQYLIWIVALVVVVVVQVTQLQLKLGVAKGFVSSLTCGLICRAIKFLDISFMFIYPPYSTPTPHPSTPPSLYHLYDLLFFAVALLIHHTPRVSRASREYCGTRKNS